jgi:hypothetical protein
MGRDDDPFLSAIFRFLILGQRENRGNQVAKTLADSRPGFNDQMVFTLNRSGNRVGHLELLLTLFVPWQPSGNGTILAQDVNRFHELEKSR